MPERFIRCQLCGIPHPAEVRECPIHRKPIVAAARMDGRGSAPPTIPPPVPRASQPPGGRASQPPPFVPRASVPPPLPGAAMLPTQMAPAQGPPPLPSARAQPPQPATLVGRLLAGRYRVTKVIAAGGMGVVYEGVQVTLGRRVAIKCLHPRYATDASAVARFQNEAMVSGSFGHPHIVEVFDLGWLDEDRSPFLVMERLEGETLGQRLQRERQAPVELVLTVARHTLSALVATHARGILHRDLKPDNIFLMASSDGSTRVKVLDFGLSKAIVRDDGSLRLTRSGTVMGTPSYMPPEQATGEPDLDGRADLYSLGMILYESLTGRLPFVARTPAALMQELARIRPSPPRLVRPEVPAALDQVVMRAIARDRRQRFADAMDMQRAVSAIAYAAGDVEEGDATLVATPAHAARRRAKDTQSVQVFERKR